MMRECQGDHPLVYCAECVATKSEKRSIVTLNTYNNPTRQKAVNFVKTNVFGGLK